MMIENKIIEILKKKKALTGKELLEESRIDELSLWRACNKSQEIMLRVVGRRYLRFDRAVKEYARLSPSIKREFLTYTVCGLKENSEEIEEKAKDLDQKIKETSEEKYNLAKKIISGIVKGNEHKEEIEKNACFIIAGDIVYNMAHLEPRPEKSTGELVRGSDLDIVIITEETLTKKIVEELDSRIYKEKYRYLTDPDFREEIDYVIKYISKIKEQLNFDSFERMIASKLLYEGKLLYGSQRMFENIKKMLFERKIDDKLAELEKKAKINRLEATSCLLESGDKPLNPEWMNLFYTHEETEEIF
jgi:hypothetical protein